MNEEQILALGGIVAGLALYMLRQRPQRVRQHDSIRTGVIFTRELMATRNKARFLAVNRMTRKCFRNLCRFLISEKGGLKALHTISIEEKIMMYIQVLKGQSIRVICEDHFKIAHTQNILRNKLFSIRTGVIFTREF